MHSNKQDKFIPTKVLVTEADGLILSHLTEAMVRSGYYVRAFVRYNSFNNWGWLDRCGDGVKDRFEVFASDLRDPNGMRAAMKGCDAVLHLAALIAIPYSYYAPDTDVDTDIKGTMKVVQAARDLGVAKVIYTSTSEVYGTARLAPVTEEHPLQGQSPYSASKIGAYQIARSFYTSFGTSVTVIRSFNTYGPRQSARAVIPTIITQIASGKRQLKLGALLPTLDFNYGQDSVGGFMAELRSRAGAGEVINLGSNFEISIDDTVRTIAAVMVAEVDSGTDEQRLRSEMSEVERLWASKPKAREMLGWQPACGGLGGLTACIAPDGKLVRRSRQLGQVQVGHPRPVDEAVTSAFRDLQIVKAIRRMTAPDPDALYKLRFTGNEWSYLKERLDSTFVSSVGKFVDRFESDLAAYSGARHAVAAVNGTAALHAALKLAGVCPGDEVLLLALTFVATANTVAYCAAIPHFLGGAEDTLCVDPQRAGQCVNRATGRVIRAGGVICMTRWATTTACPTSTRPSVARSWSSGWRSSRPSAASMTDTSWRWPACRRSGFVEPRGCTSKYWLQTLLLDEAVADQRDAILAATNDASLMTRPAWTLMHSLPAYQACPRMDMPAAKSLERHPVNLQSSAGLSLEQTR